MRFKNDPINNIQWIHESNLSANKYNPNTVFTPEMRLLELSILTTGWIQPIIISSEDIIIDGFHRWIISRNSKDIYKKYKGYVPTVRLFLDRAESMLLTIRINRAKGSHASLKMSDIIKQLIDEFKLSKEHIAKSIGATLSEVDLLYDGDVFKIRKIKDHKYSKAWYPIEQ